MIISGVARARAPRTWSLFWFLSILVNLSAASCDYVTASSFGVQPPLSSRLTDYLFVPECHGYLNSLLIPLLRDSRLVHKVNATFPYIQYSLEELR